MNPSDSSEQLDVLTKRLDVLRHLCEQSTRKRTLVEELDHSRSTINRAVRDLEEANFVKRAEDGLTATVAGRLAADHLAGFRSVFDDIVTADAVVDPLPADAPLTIDAVAGSEAMLATEPVPYRPLEGVHDALTEADRYRVVLPTLDDPRHVRLLYEHVITESSPAELLATPALLDTLREEFPRQLSAMAEHEQFRALVTDDPPPFGLCLAERDGETTVSVVVFADGGTVHGVLRNETERCVAWATSQYETVRAGASDRTDDLIPGADGADTDGGVAMLGQSLPVPLEREGFVRPTLDYFRDEPVADPTTAWRSELSLAEVHTGYAVERTVDDGATDPEDAALADRLCETLTDGTDCVVVGLPGAGKSTLCKRVACAWYDDDRGTVLYREHGRGQPFESVEDLVVTADGTDGHTLIVVEDAVRPETNAVFEAVDRLADRDDVSFLLDCRESEWVDPPARLDVPELAVTTVPELDRRDCERLVDHFEHTVGERVEVPTERLWNTIREKIGAEEVVASGMVLLLHRLSTYADPLVDEDTSLETEAATVAAELAEDDVALDVCVLVNVLNAAGVGVDRAALYAVADPDEFGAVDDALDRLEGRILFPRADGPDRTVHESWSVSFLAQLPSVLGEARATTVFGDAVTALLDLSVAPVHREQIRAHVDGSGLVERIEDDPAEWVGGMVESLADFGRNRPRLAPLFGDGETDSIDLPTVCPGEIREQWPAWLGRLFFDGDYYDCAERAFERLSEDRTLDRLLGLARTENARGEFDDAEAYAEDALDIAEKTGDRRRQASSLMQLGLLAAKRGRYDSAEEYYDRTLSITDETGARRTKASTLNNLSLLCLNRGQYQRAQQYQEASHSINRDIGNRASMAENLSNLGVIAKARGEYRTAREYLEEGLETIERTGNQRGRANTLNTLGNIALLRGRYDQATEYYRGGLDICAEIGDTQGEAIYRVNLGNVARHRGEYGQADDQYRRGLEITREIGDRQTEAALLTNLGQTHRSQGELDEGHEHAERGLDIAEELGSKKREAASLNVLGGITRERGDLDRSRIHLRDALDIATEIGATPIEVATRRELGAVARQQDRYQQATQHLTESLDACREDEHRYERATTTLERGRLALARGESETARGAVDRAQDVFTELDATHRQARVSLLRGEIAAATGSPDAAREQWRDALATFEEVGAPHDALKALRRLVETCNAAGDDERAQEWRERAEDYVTDAADSVVEQHREWVTESPEEK